MPRKKKTLPGMESKAHEDLSDAAGLGSRTRPPEVTPAGESHDPLDTVTNPREVVAAEGAGNEPATKVAGGPGCDYAPCACADADYERGGRRFCCEACADMQQDAEAEERTMDLGDVEPCLCGHAGCTARARGTVDESRLPRNP